MVLTTGAAIELAPRREALTSFFGETRTTIDIDLGTTASDALVSDYWVGSITTVRTVTADRSIRTRELCSHRNRPLSSSLR